MNVFYGVAIAFALIFLFFVYMALVNTNKWDPDNIRGYAFFMTVLTILMIMFVAMGDGKAYQEQMDAQAARYERAMINGTFKIGHNKSVEILNGDTTVTKNEPFVILLEK
jgi:phosphatidylserine synthase